MRLFALVSAIVLCQFTAFAAEEKKTSQKDIISHLMRINEKFDFLSERVDQLEEKLSVESHDEIKLNVQKMMISFVELSKKTENVSKVVKLLLDFIEKIDKKIDAHERKSDIAAEMNAQCTSVCESKVSTWVKKTKSQFNASLELERVDFCSDNSSFNNESKVLSGPSPCPNGHRCTKCPFPSSGRNCEYLNCTKENRCWQFLDKMYVVFEENIKWDGAYERCLGQGMRLAMPKSPDVTLFLINQLKTVFKPQNSICFWFGLKNTASSIEYRWIDGSALGVYVGGMANFKQHAGERWGILWLHGGTKYWFPRSAPEILSYMHYALCERRI